MHDALDHDLFIPVLNNNVMFNARGLVNFQEELFDMKDHISKHINPGIHANDATRTGSLRPTSLTRPSLSATPP